MEADMEVTQQWAAMFRWYGYTELRAIIAAKHALAVLHKKNKRKQDEVLADSYRRLWFTYIQYKDRA